MPQGRNYRGDFDPYNDMESADIHPEFVARKKLSDAEKTATNDTSSNHGRRRATVTSLRSSERSQRSDNYKTFNNNVTGRNSNTQRRSRFSRGNEKVQFSRRSRFRRFAPATLITGLLASGGFLFFFSQSALAPHLSNLYKWH